jgi:GntR family transcriptional regulator / MocR family aminotransferase
MMGIDDRLEWPPIQIHFSSIQGTIFAMPKTAPLHELALRDPQTNGTRFRWLYDELRSAIVAGTLTVGARLPSTRSVARQHALGRGTVVAVFEQLVAEGYLESIVGSGTFVSAGQEATQKSNSTKPGPSRDERSRAVASSRGRLIAKHPFPRIFTSRTAPVFRLGQPALDAFPVKLWSRIAARRLRRLSPSLLAYIDSRGWRPLRTEIAAHLGSARGIKCSPDEIVITSGTQQSLDLIARVVLDPGDRVWMEDPGYPAATALFRSVGAEVVGIPVDESGLDCHAIRRIGRPAKLAYVTPGCQFPLGVTLSLQRRQQLLQWARRTNAWIVEDDYDGEFRFAGRPLAALRSLDASGCVIYVNSFNKSLFPTLRMGFLLVPPSLVDAVIAARSALDPYPQAVDQAILCDFIAGGHMARHLRRMREVCAERIELLARRVQLELDGVMTLSPSHLGLHAVGWLTEGSNDVEAAKLAAAQEVDSMALSKFAIGRTMPPALVLGTAAGDAHAIRRGVTRLATALRK